MHWRENSAADDVAVIRPETVSTLLRQQHAAVAGDVTCGINQLTVDACCLALPHKTLSHRLLS